MNDKSQETDFLYNVGDFVTYNFTNYDRNDDVTECAVIISRRVVDTHRAYQVVWLDNLIGYVVTEYEYLEHQIRKV
jgi:uncharacterized protein (UPF0218 family)